MNSSATPPSSLRTAAIVLLFKDGFSIDDLVEIFSLDALNVQEHVRRAMFKTPIEPGTKPVQNPVQKALPAASARPKSNRSVASASGQRSCPKHLDATEFDKHGRCRICLREYAADWWKKNGKKKAAAVSGQPDRKRCSRCKEEKDIDSFDRRGRGRRPDCKQCRHDEKETGKPMGKARAPRVMRQNDLNRPAQDVESTRHLPEDEEGTEMLDESGPTPEDLASVEDTDIEEAAEPEELVAVAPAASAGTEFVFSKLCKCPKCSAPSIRLRRRRNADMKVDYWLHVKGNGSSPCMLKISHYNIKDDVKFRSAAA